LTTSDSPTRFEVGRCARYFIALIATSAPFPPAVFASLVAVASPHHS
jgi:hypothetical protein